MELRSRALYSGFLGDVDLDDQAGRTLRRPAGGNLSTGSA
jgi:hypothetical protein